MNLTKVISTELDKLKRLVVKVYRFGKSDVQTAVEGTPHGIDSNPVAGMTAVFMDSGTKGKTVIVGYLKTDRLAEIGETRLYSTDADGALQTFLWLKNDGTMELGGDEDNLVRYAATNQGIQNFRLALQAELALIAAAITVAGGTYTPTMMSIDISDGKIEEIKTSGI